MRTATGQDSTAGLERIQGTFTSWTVCLRDRSESRESYCHLAGSGFQFPEMRTATGQVSTAGHSYFLDCLFEGPVSFNRELLPGPPTYWTVSVGLVSRDFIGKSWSLSGGKFWAEA